MSRGLGKAQTAILEALRNASLPLLWSDEITQAIFGETPTRAQQETIRRAIRSLATRGLVKCHRAGDPFRTGTRLWCALPDPVSVASHNQKRTRRNT